MKNKSDFLKNTKKGFPELSSHFFHNFDDIEYKVEDPKQKIRNTLFDEFVNSKIEWYFSFIQTKENELGIQYVGVKQSVDEEGRFYTDVYKITNKKKWLINAIKFGLI